MGDATLMRVLCCAVGDVLLRVLCCAVDTTLMRVLCCAATRCAVLHTLPRGKVVIQMACLLCCHLADAVSGCVWRCLVLTECSLPSRKSNSLPMGQERGEVMIMRKRTNHAEYAPTYADNHTHKKTTACVPKAAQVSCSAPASELRCARSLQRRQAADSA